MKVRESVEVYISMHEGCSDCVESTCDCMQYNK